MSGNRETLIRDELESGGNRAAIEAFDALLAENERLREALERIAATAVRKDWPELDRVITMEAGAREALAGDGELSDENSAASFDDCLRLRDLSIRQTLTKQDGEDLSAIADRLHALLVARTATRCTEET